jgi:ABC-type sugar transport system permease subunit
MSKNKKKGSWYYRMTLSQKRGLWGLIFLTPWLVGFLAFFMRPFVQTVRFAFSTVEIGLGQINTEFIGWANFRHAFNVDIAFRQLMITLAFPAMGMVAVVVIFSLLAAILINGKYPGRSVVRTIFFIPIIMGASIATSRMVGDDQVTELLSAGVGFGGFGGSFFFQTLQATGLPMELTTFVNNAVTGIFGVLSQAGVPVLIFLAGLQSIPPSLYEVATIEGTTKYEAFWKVTLPMISPMILLSTVYTIIDLFSRHQTTVDGTTHVFFTRINTIGFGGNFGVASAMVLVYIVACLLIIGLVTYLFSKVVFYYD